MNAPPSTRFKRADENVFSTLLYLVERGDFRHAAVDRALRRVRGRGRVRQSLLPHAGRQDRSGARLRAALGDLQRHRGGFDRAAVLARLAAPHRRYSADGGDGRAAAVVEAAPAQSHRHPRRATADRLNPGTRPRSEEHTSELQSRPHLVCRLLLEKKKKKKLRKKNNKKKKKNNHKK